MKQYKPETEDLSLIFQRYGIKERETIDSLIELYKILFSYISLPLDLLEGSRKHQQYAKEVLIGEAIIFSTITQSFLEILKTKSEDKDLERVALDCSTLIPEIIETIKKEGRAQ